MVTTRWVFLAILALGIAACGPPPRIGGDGTPTPTSSGDDDDDNQNTGDALTLVGTYPMSIAADLAASSSGNVVAISGWLDETVELIDVSTPDDPRRAALISNIGYNADVQIKGNTLYINHEYEDRGIDIYDISDPANPQLKKQVGPNTGYPASLSDCHNTWPQPDRGLLYCASTSTGQLVILATGEGGMGSPEDPVFLTTVSTPEGQWGIHDMYAEGNRLYVAWLDGGLAIYDITTPDNPSMLGRTNYAGSFCHNIWPSSDGNYVFTTDEVIGGHVRVWDISNLSNITEVASYMPNQNAVVHNLEVRGNTAYVSHYTEGVKVLDITNPKSPTEIDSDDWFTGPDNSGGDPQSAMRGNWGVEVVGDRVFASGMESGLRIYQLKP